MLPTLAAVLALAGLPVGEGTSEGLLEEDLLATEGLEAGVDASVQADLVDLQVEAAGVEVEVAASSETAPEEEEPAPKRGPSRQEAVSEHAWRTAAPVGLAAVGAALWLRPDLPVRVAARAAALAWKALAPLAALPLLGGFSRIEDGELVEHPVRARILDHLQANPGASILEVQEGLEVAWGTAVYHLDRLERARHLVSARDGRLHRYWVASDPEARRRSAACLLKTASARRLAECVARRPGLHQGALCDQVGLKPPVASKWLARLEGEGLVLAQREGRRRVYRPGPGLPPLLELVEAPRAPLASMAHAC